MVGPIHFFQTASVIWGVQSGIHWLSRSFQTFKIAPGPAVLKLERVWTPTLYVKMTVYLREFQERLSKHRPNFFANLSPAYRKLSKLLLIFPIFVSLTKVLWTSRTIQTIPAFNNKLLFLIFCLYIYLSNMIILIIKLYLLIFNLPLAIRFQHSIFVGYQSHICMYII